MLLLLHEHAYLLRLGHPGAGLGLVVVWVRPRGQLARHVWFNLTAPRLQRPVLLLVTDSRTATTCSRPISTQLNSPIHLNVVAMVCGGALVVVGVDVGGACSLVSEWNVFEDLGANILKLIQFPFLLFSHFIRDSVVKPIFEIAFSLFKHIHVLYVILALVKRLF